jgi:hypothetical protein
MISIMKGDTTSTLPKAPRDMKSCASAQFHARCYPGTVAPVGMGSPYETKGKGKMAKAGPSMFTKGQPMYEKSKDPLQIRTTGGGPYGM